MKSNEDIIVNYVNWEIYLFYLFLFKFIYFELNNWFLLVNDVDVVRCWFWEIFLKNILLCEGVILIREVMVNFYIVNNA